MHDQPVQHVARPGRVGNDRVGLAVGVEIERVLTVTDFAAIDAAQPVGFEVPDQVAGMGISLAVRASGSLTDMVVLEELDMKAVLAAANKAAGAYKPAG